MQFRLTEEQLAVKDMTARFAKENLWPGILEREETLQDPKAPRSELFEMGFGALLLPEEDGGMGLDTVSYTQAIQELAAVDSALALQLAHHNVFGTMLLKETGDTSLRETWLPRVSTGEKLVAWAAAADQERPLEFRDTDEGRLLDGDRRWVSSGLVADVYMVAMREDELCRVCLVDADNPAVTRVAEDRCLGLRTAGIARLRLQGLRVEACQELAVKDGLPAGIRLLGALSWAAVSLGLMRGAAELARVYASEREQFGRSIDSFEAIRFKLADMKIREESLATLLQTAAEARDGGHLEDALRLAEMAQVAGAEGASFCGSECVQIHGGYGYSREYHAERMMRDARAMELIGGGTETMKEHVAANWIEV